MLGLTLGSSPAQQQSSIEKMQARRDRFPHSMLATATHDHKRGEDVRARLAVLSEMSAEWKQAIGRWLELSAPYCTMLGGVAAALGR